MKKLTLALAAAAMGLTASAQLYVTGNKVTGESGQWSSSAPLEVTAVDGYYTFEAEGDFKISTVKGDWNAFNGSAKTLNGSWNASGNSATGSLKAGDGNISCPSAAMTKMVTYKVNTALTTISAAWEGEEVQLSWGIVGTGVGSWDNDEMMTKQSDGTYTWTGSITGAFKLRADKGWAVNRGGAGTITANGDYDVSQGGADMSMNCTNVTLVLSADYNTLTVSGFGETPPVDPYVGGEDMYLIGSMTNTWTLPGTKMAYDADTKTYSVSLDKLAANAEFKFCGGDWKTRVLTGTFDKVGEEFTLSNGNGNIVTGVALKNVTITLKCLNNYAQGVCTIEGTPDTEVVLPESMFILGNVNGKGWAPNNGFEMTKTETGFEATFQLGNAGAGQGFFSFTESLADAEDAWSGLGIRYGAPEKDYLLLADQEATLVQAADPNAFCMEADKTVTLSIDWATMKVTILGVTSGVSTMNVEAGEAEYYNLQGVRVMNPAKGLFIRVQNGKAVKVVK